MFPICETMWGVIIFLRFTQIVGYAGVGLGIGAVLISALVIFLTIMSLSAVATNGMVQSGGVYYMMTRSLGPAVGGVDWCSLLLWDDGTGDGGNCGSHRGIA